MDKPITYGQLFDRLSALGFVDRTIDLGRGSQHIFRHKKIDTATIFLPDTPLNRSVEPMHLTTVKAVLRAHGLPVNGAGLQEE